MSIKKQERRLVVLDAPDFARKKLYEKTTEEIVPYYENMHTFEQSFKEEIDDTKKGFLSLAEGEGPVKALPVTCPICGLSTLTGKILEEEGLAFTWTDEDITPQWLDASGENPGFDLQEVTVCHNCFFASARMEYFDTSQPGKKSPSILKTEQIDRILKNGPQRNIVINDEEKNTSRMLFTHPVKFQAAYLAWQFYDRVLRDLPKERSSIDRLEIARANILSAKFARTDKERNAALSTAQVWLTQMLEHPEIYMSSELAMGTVYLISVHLSLNKMHDAKGLCDRFLKTYKREEHLKFWTERAVYLMED